MNTQSLTLTVSPAIGTVSAEYVSPEVPKCVMTLAHGAGAGMHHAFMVTLASSLAEAGIATLRFNFPFIEHKKGRPDTPAVAHATIAAAIDHAHGHYPSLPLFASGKSFGGRMTSQYLAAHSRPEVKGIVFYGFPLHPSGKPSTERAAHLHEVKAKMLFLQGTKDDLASWSTDRLIFENKNAVVGRARVFEPNFFNSRLSSKSLNPPPIERGYTISRNSSMRSW
jgi:predicted alpha/beta-hydrolase family hydrolase